MREEKGGRGCECVYRMWVWLCVYRMCVFCIYIYIYTLVRNGFGLGWYPLRSSLFNSYPKEAKSRNPASK